MSIFKLMKLAAQTPIFVFALYPSLVVGSISPPEGTPKFLGLPYNEAFVEISSGWYYDSYTGTRECPDASDLNTFEGYRHCGIDYVKRDEHGSLLSFEVLAAASGEATAYYGENNGFGKYITIIHDQTGPNGEKYCTRYGHLKSIDLENTTVKQGEKIGTAGDDGKFSNGIHLHFDVLVGGCSPWQNKRIDPYGIAKNLLENEISPDSEHYPGNAQFAGCGADHMWQYCPPLNAPNGTGGFNPYDKSHEVGFESAPGWNRWDISSNKYSDAVVDAYLRNNEVLGEKGKSIGKPYNNGGGYDVHCWSAEGENPNCDNGILIQDFKQSDISQQLWPDGHSAIIINRTSKRASAYLLREGFWAYYMSHDGFANLGSPSSDEKIKSVKINGKNISGGVIQYFEKGSLYYHPSYDSTEPYDDGITVLDTNQNVIGASTLWYFGVINGFSDVDVFQNGNYLCTTPCTDVFRVDNWVYTHSIPDYIISDIEYHANSSPETVRKTKMTASSEVNESREHFKVFEGNKEFLFLASQYGGRLDIELSHAPSVKHEKNISTTSDSAVLQGKVRANGLDTNAWFIYGETWGFGYETPASYIGDSFSEIEYQHSLMNLDCGTDYKFRLHAENWQAESMSDKWFFKTDACSPSTNKPQGSTYPASSISRTTATLGLLYRANGLETDVWLLWGESQNMNNRVLEQKTTPMSGGTMKTVLYGLECGKKYYHQAFASNADGLDAGELLSFSTLDCN